MTNDDDQNRVWTARLKGKPLFQAHLTRGSLRRAALTQPGFIQITDDHTSSVAWVAVARHPYYAITDHQGRFRLDNIPPGSYQLIAWHPPVARPSSPGTVSYTRPITAKRTITIRDGHTATITIRLRAAR